VVQQENGIFFQCLKEMSFQAMRRHKGNLNALLSERSQHEKNTYCMIQTLWHPGKGETMERTKWLVVARWWWGWVKYNWYRDVLGQQTNLV
jgi:hypothetical protein